MKVKTIFLTVLASVMMILIAVDSTSSYFVPDCADNFPNTEEVPFESNMDINKYFKLEKMAEPWYPFTVGYRMPLIYDLKAGERKEGTGL